MTHVYIVLCQNYAGPTEVISVHLDEQEANNASFSLSNRRDRDDPDGRYYYNVIEREVIP